MIFKQLSQVVGDVSWVPTVNIEVFERVKRTVKPTSIVQWMDFEF